MATGSLAADNKGVSLSLKSLPRVGDRRMPAPLDLPVRRVIQSRLRRNQPPARIASDLSLAPRTVRRLAQRLRAGDALAPCYRRSSRINHPLHDPALDFRRDHPTWGAGLIRVVLRRRFPRSTPPSVRSLQRWF